MGRGHSNPGSVSQKNHKRAYNSVFTLWITRYPTYIQTRGITSKVLYKDKRWKHLALRKPEQHTIHRVMVWWNGLIVHCYSYSVHMLSIKQIGSSIYHMYCLPTALLTSMGVSPFELMFGRTPVQHPFPSTTA